MPDEGPKRDLPQAKYWQHRTDEVSGRGGPAIYLVQEAMQPGAPWFGVGSRSLVSSDARTSVSCSRQQTCIGRHSAGAATATARLARERRSNIHPTIPTLM